MTNYQSKHPIGLARGRAVEEATVCVWPPQKHFLCTRAGGSWLVRPATLEEQYKNVYVSADLEGQAQVPTDRKALTGIS